MEDREIVELFLRRSEAALNERERKYGRYCRAIAGRILGSDSEAEECVNDALMGVWSSIPPHRPEDLAGFIGKITRQLAIKRWRRKNAAKRGGETALALEELSECLSAGAKRFGYGESKVKSMLARTRGKLRRFLTEEGVIDEQ